MSEKNTAGHFPNHIESEQGVLGCVLFDPETAAKSLDLLAARRFTEDDFYDHRHKAIFEAMMRLHESSKPVNMITLHQALGALLENIGGVMYLTTLQDCVPSAAQLPEYMATVRNKARLRSAIQFARNLSTEAMGHEVDADKLLGEQASALVELAASDTTTLAWKTLKSIMGDVISDMEQQHYTRGKTQLRGLPTGRAGNYLDKLIRGIRDSYYMVIAGRPGDGKTTKAMNIVEYLALDYVWRKPTGKMLTNAETGEIYAETTEMKGIPVVVFSIEMDSTSLGYRMVFGRSGVDTATHNEGFSAKDDVERLVRATGQLSEAQVYVDDSPGQTIGQIAAKARQIAREKNPGLFVLDYLQLVELEDGKGIDRVKELTKVSRTIMRLKKELKVPWLVLAQMNRNIETVEKSRLPVMSDLKDCGAIEQDADVILFLHKPGYEPKRKDGKETDSELIDRVTADWDWSKKPKRVDVVVAKNRYGPVGTAKEIMFPNLTRFEDFHLWKVENNAETLKKGERESLIDDDDIP